MKKLIFIFTLSFLFFTSASKAQKLSSYKTIDSFIEWNFGFAFFTDGIFPGTSVLWGKTYINENNFIFEYEAGFALPTLVTGKIGIGKKYKKAKYVFGIRPFPFHLYAQSSFPAGKKGYWIASVEYNPSNNTDHLFSFGSRAILNFGYRWNLTSSNN